jgi:hypothetical protein
MKTVTKRILAGAAALFLIFILYCFNGPLAPWMPFIIGYEIRDYDNVSVVVGAENRNIVTVFDYGKILADVEKFHGLKFHKKIRIFFLHDFTEIKRFMPWFPNQGLVGQLRFPARPCSQGPSGCEINTGDAVYIDISAVKRKNQSIEEVLKHELSHCVLHQNMGFLDTFALKSWFVEGLAVYSGGPHNFPEDEFNSIYYGTVFFYDSDFNDLYMNLPEHNPQFRYALYGKFIEYLVRVGGINKLQDLIKTYILDPESIRRKFKDVYHVELIEVLKDFENELKKKY